jgi:hypothetical protein
MKYRATMKPQSESLPGLAGGRRVVDDPTIEVGAREG